MDIIRRVPGADFEFSFKHTLTQETACQSLLLRNRREIHRAIVQYIADHSPADLRASFLALPQVQQAVDGVVFAESEGREGQNESR